MVKKLEYPDGVKVCTKCKVEKGLGEFTFRKSRGYHNSICRRCNSDYVKSRRHQTYEERKDVLNERRRKAYKENPAVRERIKSENVRSSEKNRDQLSEGKRKYYDLNKDRLLVDMKNYYQKNKEKIRDYKRDWARKDIDRNPDRWRFQANKRRCVKQNRVPRWANEDKIKEVYKEAFDREISNGIKIHVDHIVPLLSPYVSGLHCEHNLQIMQASENISKGNRRWPDMWDLTEDLKTLVKNFYVQTI